MKVSSREWASLKGDTLKSWRARYAEFNTIERIVPGVFAALYFAALARVLW